MSQSAAALEYSGECETFSADECFLGLAQRIASDETITHVFLKDVGEVVIDPLRRRYTAFIPKPEAFYQTSPGGFQTAAAKTASFPGFPERDLAELLWSAAYHASAGRLLAGSSKYDVVKLQYWPNLSRLPLTPNTMRLCAFLSRRASAIHLARKLLGIDEAEAYRFYNAALSAGALELVSRAPARNQAEPEPMEEAAPAANQSSERSVLRLLWNKVSRL